MPYSSLGRKICSACRADLPVSAFNLNRRAGDGLANQCKTCLNASRRKYRRKLPECSIEGCERRAVGGLTIQVLCSTHYRRRQHGQDMAAPVRPMAPLGAGHLNAQGYRVVMIDGKSRGEHRWVMERLLGRPLWPDENVHHVNGIKDDNRPENLELWCKPQPKGQRVSDLLDFVVKHYAKELRERLQV